MIHHHLHLLIHPHHDHHHYHRLHLDTISICISIANSTIIPSSSPLPSSSPFSSPSPDSNSSPSASPHPSTSAFSGCVCVLEAHPLLQPLVVKCRSKPKKLRNFESPVTLQYLSIISATASPAQACLFNLNLRAFNVRIDSLRRRYTFDER